MRDVALHRTKHYAWYVLWLADPRPYCVTPTKGHVYKNLCLAHLTKPRTPSDILVKHASCLVN